MKIAFTHNLKIEDVEEQAEFDSPKTVEAIASALRRLGHDVHLVEVSGPASRLVARLEFLAPDLVFNTAEGWYGRYREAFYPALFEQLRIPFAGSDAYACATTLDKRASKLVVREAGVATPASFLLEPGMPIEAPPSFRWPAIVKPNFEGSSKGIDADSIVREPAQLAATAGRLLERFPSGVLVEEFVVGRDVTVPFLEAARDSRGGVLSPASYRFTGEIADDGYVIYGYELKNELSDFVHVDIPARVDDDVRERLIVATQRVVARLGLRDLGRVDYRVTDDGEIFFIEANAIPSLEPGASIYVAAAEVGLDTVDAVLATVLESACRRHELNPSPPRTTSQLMVGITYNTKRVDPKSGDDSDAEFDSPETVNAIAGAIEALGHRPVLLEATAELPKVLAGMDVDLVFNIAEGFRGRNREAQIPALLELLEIPYTGSDPATLAITLDKGLAKRLVREEGIATPRAKLVMRGGPAPTGLRFPVIVKPNADGTSKGVTSASVARDEAELVETLKRVQERYRTPLLVEEYLPGREFTVGILGELEPRALPLMEIVFSGSDPHPVYGYGHKVAGEGGVAFVTPAEVDDELASQIIQTAIDCYETLGCRDVARVDIRLDADGVPNFVECNPLPGLSPGFSDLCLIAEAAGIDYVSLIGEIMAPAVGRLLASREVA